MRSFTSLISVIALVATQLPAALSAGTAEYTLWSASNNCNFGKSFHSSGPNDGTCFGATAANTMQITCNSDGSWNAQQFASAFCGAGIPIFDISGSGTGCTAGNSYSIEVNCNGQVVSGSSTQTVTAAVVLPTLLLAAGYILNR